MDDGPGSVTDRASSRPAGCMSQPRQCAGCLAQHRPLWARRSPTRPARPRAVRTVFFLRFTPATASASQEISAPFPAIRRWQARPLTFPRSFCLPSPPSGLLPPPAPGRLPPRPTTPPRHVAARPPKALACGLPPPWVTASPCRPSLWRHAGHSARWNHSRFRTTAAASLLSRLGIRNCAPTRGSNVRGQLGSNPDRVVRKAKPRRSARVGSCSPRTLRTRAFPCSPTSRSKSVDRSAQSAPGRRRRPGLCSGRHRTCCRRGPGPRWSAQDSSRSALHRYFFRPSDGLSPVPAAAAPPCPPRKRYHSGRFALRTRRAQRLLLANTAEDDPAETGHGLPPSRNRRFPPGPDLATNRLAGSGRQPRRSGQ